MHKHHNIKVPISVCRYAYVNRCGQSFRLLILLKLHCDGTIHRKDPRIDDLKKVFYESDKDGSTYRRHFKKLVALNWVWVNTKSKIIHINSFDKIQRKLNIKGNRRVHVEMDFMKRSIQPFLLSAIVGDKIDRNKKGFRKGVESTCGVSSVLFNENSSILPKKYFGYGIRSIAKDSGYSLGAIHKHMEAARRYGYVTCNGKWAYHEFHKSELGHLKAAFPNLAKRLWPLKGMVRERLNNEILPHLHFCSRRLKYRRLDLQSKVITKAA